MGPLQIGWRNGSFTTGVSMFGVEAHGGFGFGGGLGEFTAGVSYTDKDGKISGGDLTVRPGLGAVAEAIATWMPQLSPSWTNIWSKIIR